MKLVDLFRDNEWLVILTLMAILSSTRFASVIFISKCFQLNIGIVFTHSHKAENTQRWGPAFKFCEQIHKLGVAKAFAEGWCCHNHVTWWDISMILMHNLSLQDGMCGSEDCLLQIDSRFKIQDLFIHKSSKNKCNFICRQRKKWTPIYYFKYHAARLSHLFKW